MSNYLNKDDGFTLIETVVGLTLLSIVLVLCYNGLVIGLQSHEKSWSLAEETEKVLVLEQNLRMDLKKIRYPVFANYLNNSTNDQIAFQYYNGNKEEVVTLQYKEEILTLLYNEDETIIENYGLYKDLQMIFLKPGLLEIKYRDLVFLYPMEVNYE